MHKYKEVGVERVCVCGGGGWVGWDSEGDTESLFCSVMTRMKMYYEAS